MGKIIRNLYMIMMGIIFILLFFVDTSVQYSTIETEKLSNIFLIIIDVAILYMISRIYIKYREKIDDFIEANYHKILLIGTIVVFVIQIFVVYHIYFYTGWDCRRITDTAEYISKGHIPQNMIARTNYYYSTCPNNIMLTEIFSKLYFILRLFGLKNGYQGLIVIGIVIVDLVALILAKTTKMMTGSKKYAMIAWLIYAVWIAQLPWWVIPYTDTYAIIFPILELQLYLLFQRNEGIRKWIFALMLGLITCIAYFIKPTTVIVLIAVMIYEFVHMISERKYHSFLIVLLCSIIGFAGASGINHAEKRNLSQYIKMDDEKALTMTHYMMMGMNTEHTGTYLRSDRIFSASLPNKEIRKQTNIKVIKKRLKDFGPEGYGKFLGKKTLVNYNSGMMAWGREGNFIRKESKIPKTRITNILRSFYYTDAEHYCVLTSYAQAMWLLVLSLGFVGAILTKKNKKIGNYEILLLTIMGITAFTLLFEARARYLYIMTPIYIILACYGIKNIGERKVIKDKE